MNALKKLFRPDLEKIEIPVLKSCMIGGAPYSAGDTVKVTRAQLADLVAAEAAHDPAAAAVVERKRAVDEAVLPPPVTPAPMPEEWSQLPQCFADWWKLNGQLRALETRRDQIEKLNADRVVKKSNFMATVGQLPAPSQAVIFSLDRGQAVAEQPEVSERLKDGLRRAEAAIDDWRTANHDDLVRAQLLCSDHTQAVHGRYSRKLRELHAAGFDLFQIRLSALGLSKPHVQRLYYGSSDYERFGSIPAPAIQDLKLQWIEESGEPRHYIAQSPRNLARLISDWETSEARVEELNSEAQSELARARKVTGKAA